VVHKEYVSASHNSRSIYLLLASLLMSVHSDECFGLKPQDIVNYVD